MSHLAFGTEKFHCTFLPTFQVVLFRRIPSHQQISRVVKKKTSHLKCFCAVRTSLYTPGKGWARDCFLMKKSFIQSSKPSNHIASSAFGLEGGKIFLPKKIGIKWIALYQIIHLKSIREFNIPMHHKLGWVYRDIGIPWDSKFPESGDSNNKKKKYKESISATWIVVTEKKIRVDWDDFLSTEGLKGFKKLHYSTEK